jgi:hypothetical protein
MAVTKQTYTATATWTASQLANLFRDAFIDAGLMSAWYDSFLSGAVENRVLEIQYDNTKTYGKTYYWFQFTTTGVFIHVATGWNTASDIPASPSGAGTQWLDWTSTATNVTTNHTNLVTLAAANDAVLDRYSSNAQSGFSWFVLRNGATNVNFHIPRAGVPRPAWIDLDRMLYHPWMDMWTGISSSLGMVRCRPLRPCLRRSWVGGAALVESTAIDTYTGNTPLGQSSWHVGINYASPGNANNNASANLGSGQIWGSIMIMPTAFANTNPAYSTNFNPVFTEINYNFYINEGLPADFGIAFHYAANTMAIGDKLIVTASSEEWEMLALNNNSGINTGSSPLFLARVV